MTRGDSSLASSPPASIRRYLCPHLLNSHKFLKEADIFSLGATAYELASGKPIPKAGEGWHALRQGLGALPLPPA